MSKYRIYNITLLQQKEIDNKEKRMFAPVFLGIDIMIFVSKSLNFVNDNDTFNLENNLFVYVLVFFFHNHLRQSFENRAG